MPVDHATQSIRPPIAYPNVQQLWLHPYLPIHCEVGGEVEDRDQLLEEIRR